MTGSPPLSNDDPPMPPTAAAADKPLEVGSFANPIIGEESVPEITPVMIAAGREASKGIITDTALAVIFEAMWKAR